MQSQEEEEEEEEEEEGEGKKSPFNKHMDSRRTTKPIMCRRAAEDSGGTLFAGAFDPPPGR